MSDEINHYLVYPMGKQLPRPEQQQSDPARIQRARLLMHKYEQRTAKVQELLACIQRGQVISNTHLLMAQADVEAVIRVITGDAVDIEDF